MADHTRQDCDVERLRYDLAIDETTAKETTFHRGERDGFASENEARTALQDYRRARVAENAQRARLEQMGAVACWNAGRHIN
jgi:hypothetical protein